MKTEKIGTKLIRLLPDRLRRKRITRIVQPFTLVGCERIMSLYNLARRIDREKIPGDVVECGVGNGGTAAILSHLATHSKIRRTVWLFDSFEGMPPTTEIDGEAAKLYVGKVLGNIENVRLVLKLVDADMRRVRIVKGLLQNTFHNVTIPKIALLNIDIDWYEPVKFCLEAFYDTVVPGGFITIDDYGHWPGCKQAVDEFLRARNLSLSLNEVGYTARWFRKQ